MDYLLIFLGVMIFLFAVGVPVAISIGLTCLVVLVVQGGIEKIPEELFAMQMLSGLNNFPIIAVPFFILAASLMNTGSSNERIFNFATALVGPIRGGLGHVNVLASVIFAGMSATASFMTATCVAVHFTHHVIFTRIIMLTLIFDTEL